MSNAPTNPPTDVDDSTVSATVGSSAVEWTPGSDITTVLGFDEEQETESTAADASTSQAAEQAAQPVRERSRRRGGPRSWSPFERRVASEPTTPVEQPTPAVSVQAPLPVAPQQLATLEARDITAWFGDHQVLDRVSLTMEAGQVTALIGPSRLRQVDVPAHPEPDARARPFGLPRRRSPARR